VGTIRDGVPVGALGYRMRLLGSGAGNGVDVMLRMIRPSAVLLLVLALGACSGMNRTQQRALSGGAIGAGGGALVGAVTGGSPVTGALIGGAGGAAIGALTR
jgi:hypothetical protein